MHPSGAAFSERQGIFIVKEEQGAAHIYKATDKGYSRLTDSGSFNGHPAGGPVWWDPDFAWS